MAVRLSEADELGLSLAGRSDDGCIRDAIGVEAHDDLVEGVSGGDDLAIPKGYPLAWDLVKESSEPNWCNAFRHGRPFPPPGLIVAYPAGKGAA